MHVRAKETDEGGSRERNLRRLGAYYTPDSVARTLTRWALPSGEGKILDPSFGGCSFLRAGLALAAESAPGAVEVFGFDVDVEAQTHVEPLFELGMRRQNAQIGDFFSFTADESGVGKVHAIVGNPPYIRHHWQTSEGRKLASERSSAEGLALPASADLWCYFLVHALSFLDDGGRLAFLLPLSFKHASYARDITDFLAGRFETIRLIEVNSRLFERASEGTIIVAAAEHRRVSSGRGTVRLGTVATGAEIQPALERTSWGRTVDADRRTWLLGGLPSPAQGALRETTALETVRTLGSVARIRIGCVTGANAFFIRNENVAAVHTDRRTRWRTIVTRSSQLRLTTFTAADELELRRSPAPTQLLLASPDHEPSEWLAAEIGKAVDDGINDRHHCSKRHPWYCLTDTEAAQAFIPYMGAHPSRVVLNEAGALCTNAIHRVWWTDGLLDPRDVVVGSWTSLYALTAEIHGRSYGGGVLKLEPSELSQTSVPIVPGAGAVLGEVEAMVRAGRFSEATTLADRRVLRQGIGLNAAEIEHLRNAARTLGSRRRTRR